MINLVIRAENACQDLARITTIVTVVEQTDIELGTQGHEELLQSAGPLREVEHVQALVGHVGATADEVPDMALGELIAGEIRHRHVVRPDAL